MLCSGSRVIAVVSIKNGNALVLGEGTYVGDAVPDPVEFPHLKWMHDSGIPCPKIELHSGDVIWGCECWWGGVNSMKAKLAQCRSVVVVTPTEMREGISPSGSKAGPLEGIQSL